MESLVSIIVLIYNVGPYLNQCLDSILEQTYQELEILLIDDGSTDDSTQICRQYTRRDKRVRLICQENQGVSGARNRGIRESKGEYLVFIDGDDYIDSHMVEVLYTNLMDYNADISICELSRVNYPQEQSMIHPLVSDENSEIKIYSSEEVIEELTGLDANKFIVTCRMVKKSLYDHLEYPLKRRYEDEYIAHHLYGNAERIIYTNRILYYYVQRPDSAMHQAFSSLKFQRVGAFQDRADYCIQHHIYSEKAVYMYLKTYKAFLDRYGKNFPENKAEIRYYQK